jgi:hypothetical protein
LLPKETASKVFLERKQRKMRKLMQSYQIEIQQTTFYFTNLICENLWCLRHLRAYDTATFCGLQKTIQHNPEDRDCGVLF